VQDIFKKNTTRRVEIFFENPAGLGLAQKNEPHYLCLRKNIEL